MNKKIILWISALIITFLTAFLHQRLSPYYPVSGSIGIEGEKVTYVFPKIKYGKEPVKILVRKDINGLQGIIKWRNKNSSEWHQENMTDEQKYLSAFLEPPAKGNVVEYNGELLFNSKKYKIPANNIVDVTFTGRRPSSVMNVLYFFLFGGLLLAVRGALEYFNAADKRMLFSLLSTMFFFVASVIFYPFIKSYELDVINKSIPDVLTLFDTALIAIFLIWTACTLLLFKYKNKIFLLITGIFTLIIYQFSNFY